uniref:Uncharacterized protein n=1 Tax=Dendroctonus ponderosae TaxID=77166 RepID=A0AAR5PVT3_DENPD
MLPAIKTMTKRASNDAQFTFRNYVAREPYVNERSVVSLALKEAHSVAVDISLDTLKAFIVPFAKALHFGEILILNNQTSQTSYMNNFKIGHRLNVEYTPLQVDHQSDTLHLETNSDLFERQILKDLQNNLVSQLSYSNEIRELENSNLCETKEFDEEDQMGACEGLAEMLVDLPPEGKSPKFLEDKAQLHSETAFPSNQALDVGGDLKNEDPVPLSGHPNLKTGSEHVECSVEDKVVEVTGAHLQLKDPQQRVCEDDTAQSSETESEPDSRKCDEQKSSEVSSSIFDSGSFGSTFAIDDPQLSEKDQQCSEFISYDDRIENEDKLTFALEAPSRTEILNDVPETGSDLVENDLECPQNATNEPSEEQLFQTANSTFLTNFKEDETTELMNEFLNVQIDEGDEGYKLEHNDYEVVNDHTSLVAESVKSLAQNVEACDKPNVEDGDEALTAKELNQILNGRLQDLHNPTVTVERVEDSPITMNGSVQYDDARIRRLASLIIDHVLDQGFENSDLVVFSELARDPYVAKLVTKLKMLHTELFSQAQTSEQRNDYRISLASCVLNLLSNDERFSYDGSSDDYLAVSNKLFSISEYVSEVLDYFFDDIDNDEFCIFSRDLSDESIVKSTPDKKLSSSVKEGDTDTQSDSPILDGTVTTFKKDSTSASEILWISISPSVAQPAAPRSKRRVINVDEIPLKPPPDLACRCRLSENYQCGQSGLANSPERYFRSLSPIGEEPRINLFDSHLSPTHGIRSDSSESQSDLDLANESDLCTVGSNRSDSGHTKSENKFLSSTSSQREVNIVISNEVNFFRAKSNVQRFAHGRRVVFTTDVMVTNREGDKENIAPNNSGDWMGFEKAKF